MNSPKETTATELLRSTHISYSKLETYKKCPMRFKLEYLDGHSSLPSDAMQLGTVVHSIIEKYLNQIKGVARIFTPTHDELRLLIAPVCNELRRDGDLNARISDSEILPYLRNFVTLMPRIDGSTIRSIEGVKRTRLGPWIMKSILDLVLVDPIGELHVIDFKTGKPDYVRNAQLRTYSLPLLGDPSTKTKQVKASYFFLKTGTIRSFNISRDECQEVVDSIVKTVRDIESDNQFVAKPNRLCNWCGVKQHCPAY